MWTWILIIMNIVGSIASIMIIDRGITETGQNDILLGLTLLFLNICCLAINIYRKENDV